MCTTNKIQKLMVIRGILPVMQWYSNKYLISIKADTLPFPGKEIVLEVDSGAGTGLGSEVRSIFDSGLEL